MLLNCNARTIDFDLKTWNHHEKINKWRPIELTAWNYDAWITEFDLEPWNYTWKDKWMEIDRIWRTYQYVNECQQIQTLVGVLILWSIGKAVMCGFFEWLLGVASNAKCCYITCVSGWLNHLLTANCFSSL